MLLLSAAARAEDRVALQWSAPAECPDGKKIVAEVDRLLGSSTAAADKPIHVTAEVRREEGGGFRVKLTAKRNEETRDRELRAASCKALADATAVILALMIDPTAVTAAPEVPSPPPPPSPPSPPSPPPPLSPSPPPPPSPPSPPSSPPPSPPSHPPPPSPPVRIRTPEPPTRWIAAVWSGADVGSLPGVSFGLGAVAALDLGAQRFEAGLGYRLPQTASVPDQPAAGGKVDLLAGWAATCRALVTAPVEIGPCLGLELGRIHAVGFGVTSPGEGSYLWLAALAGGVLTWAPVPSMAVGLRVDLAAPINRPRFVLEGAGPVHQPGPVAGRASAMLGARF